MIKLKKNRIRFLLHLLGVVGILTAFSYSSQTPLISTSYANHVCCCNKTSCCQIVGKCGKGGCKCQSDAEKPITIQHITDEFIQHREWLIKIFWEAHILPSLMLMTEQITAVSMQQMLIVGSLFDAKHQLETQRLLQDLRAQAHKDYQPSTGMCQFGTITKSLAASDRNAEFTKIALSKRNIQRQLLNGDNIGGSGPRDDSRSRLAQFQKSYCNPNDLGGGLKILCGEGGDKKRLNNDVHFTNIIGLKDTLEIDLTNGETTADEEDVFALSLNLYGATLMPFIPADKIASKDGSVVDRGALVYMKMRSLMSQRAVAENAFSALAGMKAQGKKKFNLICKPS